MTSVSVAAKRDVFRVANADAARALSGGRVSTVFIGSADGGLFRRDASDTTSAEDGGAYCGTVIRCADFATAGVLRRDFKGGVYPEWFGAVRGVESTAEFQAAIAAAAAIGGNEVLLSEGQWISGQLKFNPAGFSLIGVGRPRNQDQTSTTSLQASAPGTELLVPDMSSAPSAVSNITIKNVDLRGYDDGDITTKCLYVDEALGVSTYGVLIEDVGFIDCDFGYHIKGAFGMTVRRPHGWNCATAIGYGGDGPSNVFDNPRTGLCPAGADFTITGITRANPAVVTAAGHGLTDGRLLYLDSVVGMTDVNNKLFVAANVTTDTFELQGVNSTAFGAYVSGGLGRRTSVGYWLMGPDTLVLNHDTAAESSGSGSFCFIVGESAGLTLSGAATTSSAQFVSAHLEGTKGGFIWVASGSSASGPDCHFITSSTPLPRAVYYEFLNKSMEWERPLFTTKSGGSYTTNFEVASVQKGRGALVISPKDPGALSSATGITTTTGLVYRTLVAASARPTSDISVPNSTETLVATGTENYDTNNFLAAGVFLPTVPGLYRVSGGVYFSAAVVGATYDARIKRAGSEVSRASVQASSTSGLSVPISMTLTLDGTQDLQIYAYQSSGAAATLSGSFRTTLNFEKLSA